MDNNIRLVVSRFSTRRLRKVLVRSSVGRTRRQTRRIRHSERAFNFAVFDRFGIRELYLKTVRLYFIISLFYIFYSFINLFGNYISRVCETCATKIDRPHNDSRNNHRGRERFAKKERDSERLGSYKKYIIKNRRRV